MKKKLLTTLLLGVTLATGVSAMSTSSANACELTHEETVLTNYHGPKSVEMGLYKQQLWKRYPTLDGRHTIVEYGHKVYCFNADGTPTNGSAYNDLEECICVYGEVVAIIQHIRA